MKSRYSSINISHLRYLRTILSLTALLVLLSCANSMEERLKQYGSDGKVNELIEFIKQNKNGNKFDLVSIAIEQICKNKFSEGLTYLEDIFYYSSTSQKIKDIILTAYDKNALCFNNLSQLIDNLLYDENYSSKSVANILKNCNEKDLIASLLKSRDLSISLEKYNVLSKSLNVQKNLQISYCPSEQKILDILNSAYSNNGRIYLSPDAYDVVNQISTINNNLSSLDNLDEKIEDLYLQLGRLEERREKYDYFWISGYIVAYYKALMGGGEEYEIKRSGFRLHSILQTSKTIFQSKGTFRLKVKLIDTVPVRVKEEFGGFTQTWDVYKEVTDSEIDEYDRLTNSIKNKKKEIRELENSKNPTKANELKNKILILEKELSRNNDIIKSKLLSLMTESKEYYSQKYN